MQARLTFNYWRRGGYQIGSEDYRWHIIKDQIPSWAFFLLNVTFIATIQSVRVFVPSVRIVEAHRLARSCSCLSKARHTCF